MSTPCSFAKPSFWGFRVRKGSFRPTRDERRTIAAPWRLQTPHSLAKFQLSVHTYPPYLLEDLEVLRKHQERRFRLAKTVLNQVLSCESVLDEYYTSPSTPPSSALMAAFVESALMSLGKAADSYHETLSMLMPQSTFTTISNDFAWESIRPSKHLVYHDCFSNFKCARLEMPMDWNASPMEDDRTVAIAIVKLEATVPLTDATYGGPVILNPGGPGGSGIHQVLRGGKDVQALLSAGPDALAGKTDKFDILGFDPRGINNSRPALICHPDGLSAAAWDLEMQGFGMLGSSNTAFDNIWASKRALAAGCSEREAKHGIAKHMTTAPVARDIVEIFERHGEWREAEAGRLLSNQGKPYTYQGQWLQGEESSAEDVDAVLKRTRWRKGKEMIQYWGFSYGTILGATLSAMFPDRIHRAVLDGVADSHDYMAGGWKTNLQDTDIEIVKFADYCYHGGAEHCAMYDEDGPAVITSNFMRAVKKIRADPISVPGTDITGPMVVTYSDFKRLVWDVVYNPLLRFPLTARVLYDIMQGNGSSLAAWKMEQMPRLNYTLSEQCRKDGPYSPSCFEQGGSEMSRDATSGILCTDGASTTDVSKDEYMQYAKEIMGQSTLIGESWATIRMPCTAWNARPKWRYGGNFHNTTSHPILFIGNTVDPVTPLRNALTMAKGFKGAGVLHQNSEGHCTYAAPSLCSGKVLRMYFQAGLLPTEGTVCEPDVLPFDGYSEDERPEVPEGGDEEMWRALVGLNRAWP